jgi:hypothetical protein
MIAFRADPENPSRIIAESGRQDEIGTAEEELGVMQRELASMLHQQSRLAALGLAAIGFVLFTSDRLTEFKNRKGNDLIRAQVKKLNEEAR